MRPPTSQTTIALTTVLHAGMVTAGAVVDTAGMVADEAAGGGQGGRTAVISGQWSVVRKFKDPVRVRLGRGLFANRE